MRVLRNANDKRRWDADHWRRYRCRSSTCSWQGLLAVQRRRQRSPGSGGPMVLRMGRAALLLLLAAGVTWGGISALQFMRVL